MYVARIDVQSDDQRTRVEARCPESLLMPQRFYARWLDRTMLDDKKGIWSGYEQTM